VGTISRRQLVKKAAVAGAALAVSPMIFVPKARAAWERGSPVHPNINNLRVVGITDPKMIRGIQLVSSWAAQEKLVQKEVVWENMDKLACALTETRNPEEGWRTIFLKPPRKPWSETVVAIKTNNIALQHTRSAVMAKIGHIFTGLLGVKAGGIHIYDAVNGGSMGRNTPFAGLPEGVRIEDQWGGATTFTSVLAPWKKRGNKAKCIRPLVDGSVDILINIALCKGHSDKFGGFTMTMKNHFGTLDPTPGHREGATDYLMAINQTPEILGSMDKKTGRVLYPRQQLCIVDALWASEGGPGGYPRSQPNFLAMGVFSPVVDYLMAARFRKEKMGWEVNMEVTRRMLADFGYQERDLPGGGKLIEI
jgi:hypothetical protein